MKINKKLTKSIFFMMLIIVLTFFIIDKNIKIKEVKADTVHSSKLSKLEIKNHEEELDFKEETTEYNISLYTEEMDLIITTEKVDNDANVEITGDKYLKNATGVVTITVTAPEVKETVYKINYAKTGKRVVDFSCTENEQVYVVPKTGTYLLETWGAQGGYRTEKEYGGKGGYSKGKITLNQGEKLYVYVGCQGNSGGYNGGGQRPKYPGGGVH